MIYTTNFSSLRKLLHKDIVPISIAGKSLGWYMGIQYKKLAPKYNFFMEWKQNRDNNYYVEHFQKEVLDTLNVNQIYLELNKLTENKDFALVCYEPKPYEDMTYKDIIESDRCFCHRHLVAKWFRDNGYEIKEY